MIRKITIDRRKTCGLDSLCVSYDLAKDTLPWVCLQPEIILFAGTAKPE